MIVISHDAHSNGTGKLLFPVEITGNNVDRKLYENCRGSPVVNMNHQCTKYINSTIMRRY